MQRSSSDVNNVIFSKYYIYSFLSSNYLLAIYAAQTIGEITLFMVYQFSYNDKPHSIVNKSYR